MFSSLTPLERKQHSIDKIDLPSSEGPTDHEVKHERTRLCTRRLNGIEIVAQFQQEESIMRSKSSRLSRMTKPNWVFASLNNPVAEVKDVGIPRVSGYETKQLYCLGKLMCGSKTYDIGWVLFLTIPIRQWLTYFKGYIVHREQEAKLFSGDFDNHNRARTIGITYVRA